MDEFLARGRAVDESLRVAEAAVVAAGEDSQSQKERENVEKIEREQIEEEKEENEKVREKKKEDGELEPDVLPQKEEGVDRPIAS